MRTKIAQLAEDLLFLMDDQVIPDNFLEGLSVNMDMVNWLEKFVQKLRDYKKQIDPGDKKPRGKFLNKAFDDQRDRIKGVTKQLVEKTLTEMYSRPRGCKAGMTITLNREQLEQIAAWYIYETLGLQAHQENITVDCPGLPDEYFDHISDIELIIPVKGDV